ncbi:very short patch repair endonuclease [Nocardiopsis sp. MG754419]|uniref:very short patch repair endonuclease n=1 Tax=Nocardiopsis sp. MG754419 TaxID=2259865 RepID=UPI001BAC9EA8|nr:very short patch repair endonuclease [Nocardiopsis sp. MG754419]MBR8744261.1 very short patch repair endonuclease [Nocardiopsis sp. MG754419]
MDARRPTRAANEGTRRSMRANKGRDTRPELAIRRRVHAAGLRYRVSARPVPTLRRTADLVFTRLRVAVFVDGCFWHGCPEHHTKAATNAGYWAEKVRVNRARDADTNARLVEEGWRVVRVWEHEDPDAAAGRVIAEVHAVRDAARTGSG